MFENQNQIMNQTYQNTSYNNEREKTKSLVLDINILDGTSFTASLIEPFIIDKLSDVYLDSFTTHDALINSSSSNMGFLLGIDQFNIQTNTNNQNTFNKIFIPNTDSSGTNKTVVNKGKKLNYICQINPCTLSNISGTITNCPASGSVASLFHSSNGRFVAEFIFTSRT